MLNTPASRAVIQQVETSMTWQPFSAWEERNLGWITALEEWVQAVTTRWPLWT